VKKLARAGGLVVLFSLVSPGPLLAAGPDIPPGQDAGSQYKRFRDEAMEVQLRSAMKKEKSPPIEIEKREPPPSEEEEVSFVLTELKITGAAFFKPEEFRPFYEPYLQKEVTFKDLQIVAETIKAKYLAKGFLTTSVYFPEQEVENGVFEIAVLEGKLGEVTLTGNKWFSKKLVRKYIHAKPGELLNIKKFQKDILRLNQFSDLEVKTVISPGTQPETSDITLKVKDKFPFHVGMSEDNRGTRLTEKYRTGFYARASNLLGIGDSIFVNALFNSRTFGQVVSYTLPLDTRGTKFILDLSYFTMRLGKEVKAFDVTGKTETLTPHLSLELALSEDFEAYLDLGINMQSIKKRVDLTLVSDDQLRIPYFSFNVKKTDSLLGGGQTFYTPRFSFGTGGFLGASKSCHSSASRDGTGGYYFKYEHGLRRTQRMPFGSYLLMDSQFQAASHALPPSEQLQLGGMTSVRGYPEGDYVADVGAVLNLDWVFPAFFLPKDWKLPRSETPLRRMIEPVAFFDMGGGGLYAVNSGSRGRKFLAGAGGGLRIHIANNLSLRLEWAKAFGNAPQGGNGPSTFYIMIQAET
jgi:hemolysin activation/secretion protein